MRKLVFVFLSTLLFSCDSAPSQLGAVDLKVFRSDRGACKNLRRELIEDLKAEKDKIVGLSENEVIEILGRYDVQVLDRRQKKMFVYYLDAGSQCENMQNPGFGRTMILRFNAVALVREVSFKIGLP